MSYLYFVCLPYLHYTCYVLTYLCMYVCMSREKNNGASIFSRDRNFLPEWAEGLLAYRAPSSGSLYPSYIDWSVKLTNYINLVTNYECAILWSYFCFTVVLSKVQVLLLRLMFMHGGKHLVVYAVDVHIYINIYMQSHYRPWQGLRVPGVWGSQVLRKLTHGSGKVVSPTHRLPLPQEIFLPGTHFCWRLSRTEGHNSAGRITSMKNSNGTIRIYCIYIYIHACIRKLDTYTYMGLKTCYMYKYTCHLSKYVYTYM
jgi:hypothetical protein